MRIVGQILCLAAMLAVAAPAVAKERPRTVSLRAGEAVTLTLDDGDRLHETARGPAARLSRFEAAAVWNLTRGVYGDALGPNSAAIYAGEDGVPDPGPIEPGAIRIKLVSLGEGGTLLVLENGYERAFSYRATIRRPGPRRATDVCEVMPSRYGFEHWPYRIDRIELSGLTPIRWIEGQAPVCR